MSPEFVKSSFTKCLPIVYRELERKLLGRYHMCLRRGFGKFGLTIIKHALNIILGHD